MGVVIVHDMEEAPPATRHPLHEPSPEMRKRDGDLHDLVVRVTITGAEEHDIVVARQMAVGDGDGGGALHDVDEPVLAHGGGDVVDPDVGGREERDAVAVGAGPVPDVVRRVADHAAVGVLDVVDVEVVYDDVGPVLDREPCAFGDVHLGAAAVDGGVAVDDELLGERDDHVLGEDDPDGLRLDDAEADGAGPWVLHVGVRRVRHDVDLAAQAARGVLAEPLGATGQAHPVRRPVLAAPPATVDRVRRLARPVALLLLPLERPPRARRPAFAFVPTYIITKFAWGKESKIRWRALGACVRACLWTARLKLLATAMGSGW